MSDSEENPMVKQQAKPRRKPNRGKRKTESPVISCTKCNIGFPTYVSFEHHMSQVHKVTHPYPCKLCGKGFGKRENRTKHEITHNPKRTQGEPKFACDICGKSYHLIATMKSHRMRFHFGYISPSRLIGMINRKLNKFIYFFLT